MKQILLILTILLGITNLSWSQGENIDRDSLYVIKKSNDFSFFNKGIEIGKRDYLEVISANPEAKKLFQKANNKAILAGVFNFAGWFGIGWTLGSFLASDSPDQVNWLMGAIGLGSVLVSLPIVSSAASSHDAAAKKFNDGLNKNLSLLKDGDLTLQFSMNRIGLQINF